MELKIYFRGEQQPFLIGDFGSMSQHSANQLLSGQSKEYATAIQTPTGNIFLENGPQNFGRVRKKEGGCQEKGKRNIFYRNTA